MNQFTETVFADLTAAYDTLNNRILLLNITRVTRDARIVKILQSLLTNRFFYVEMDGRKRHWRILALSRLSINPNNIININSFPPERLLSRRFV